MIFFLACLKFQCLPILINNQTTCECANRRVPCHANHTSNECDDESLIQEKRQLTSFGKIIDLSFSSEDYRTCFTLN